MEQKKLSIRRLVPPAETQREIVKKENSVMPKNPIKRFLKIFFGEGF